MLSLTNIKQQISSESDRGKNFKGSMPVEEFVRKFGYKLTKLQVEKLWELKEKGELC